MLIACEADLVAAMRARREELGLSHLATDDKGGTQSGYIGKLENPDKSWGKRAVHRSFWWWLGALDLVLLAIPSSAVRSSPISASKSRQDAPLYVSMRHTAEVTGLSIRTIERLIKRKRLEARKEGRRRLVLYSSILAWTAERPPVLEPRTKAAGKAMGIASALGSRP